MGAPARLGRARVLVESDKALLVEIDDLGESVWIPKSMIHDDSEVYDANENADGELVVEEWWAVKKGWT